MEPKKRGRPAKPGRLKRSVSLRFETWAVVAKLAEAKGISMSDALAEIVVDWKVVQDGIEAYDRLAATDPVGGKA